MIPLLFGLGVGAAVFIALIFVGKSCGFSGSWVKEDGTIIEWDGDGRGGGRILHPDGRLEEFPR